jgi:two-component system chemotaxis response regulator CheY
LEEEGVKQVRVLIVDDLEFMRTAIREILQSAGISVAGEAVDGMDGIRKYHELRPDVVLMDITMPRLDGLNALKRIRREDPLARVVMCSSLGQDRYIIRAIQLGARDFIVKPFRPQRVVSAVKKAAGVEE